MDLSARVVDLPGAGQEIAFDDIVYSRESGRILVPSRRSGLYVIDPHSGAAKRLGRLGSADSADEGGRLIFVADRGEEQITGIDAATGRTVFSLTPSGPVDYVRYVARTRELWVTEPGGSPPGIEIFALGSDPGSHPARAGFVPVTGGPEALAVASDGHRVYTHADNDLVNISVDRRAVMARWHTGCNGTHGFPQLDEMDGLALASCASNGEVSLLRLDDGRQLGRYAAGGGLALPAHAATTNHFYVRGDPGTKIVTLEASQQGLTRVDDVTVPRTGHCLTADDQAHYWTCDADHGRVLRFDDR